MAAERSAADAVVDEHLDVATVLSDIERAEAGDAEWDDIVASARTRLKVGFSKGEVDAKTAAAIILADARIREKSRPPEANPLDELGDQAAKVFGIKRSATAQKGRPRARAR